MFSELILKLIYFDLFRFSYSKLLSNQGLILFMVLFEFNNNELHVSF